MTFTSHTINKWTKFKRDCPFFSTLSIFFTITLMSWVCNIVKSSAFFNHRSSSTFFTNRSSNATTCSSRKPRQGQNGDRMKSTFSSILPLFPTWNGKRDVPVFWKSKVSSLLLAWTGWANNLSIYPQSPEHSSSGSEHIAWTNFNQTNGFVKSRERAKEKTFPSYTTSTESTEWYCV